MIQRLTEHCLSELDLSHMKRYTQRLGEIQIRGAVEATQHLRTYFKEVLFE